MMVFQAHAHRCAELVCAERIACNAPPEMDERGELVCPYDDRPYLFWCEVHDALTFEVPGGDPIPGPDDDKVPAKLRAITTGEDAA